MALTPSTMAPLGSPAPPFKLEDTGGKLVSLDDFKGAPGLLVIFLCCHCPYVKHIQAGLAEFAREYQEKGLAIAGINANDVVKYPQDNLEAMRAQKQAFGFVFPYLLDETQEVAKSYRAACTPDFFLFDKARRLVYRGQFDDSRPESGVKVTGKDLRAAADLVLAGKPVPAEQRPSMGCNIKWKPGNEPLYYGKA